MKHQTTLAGAAWAVVFCVGARADVLLDPPHDFENGMNSTLSTAGFPGRTADDITIADDFLITRMTFWMIVTWPNTPGFYGVEIYRNHAADRPLDPPIHTIVGETSATNLGLWHPDYPQYRFFEIRFDDVNLSLSAGTYWIVPWGWGNENHDDRAFWATANFGGPLNGFEGHHKGGHLQIWLPVSTWLGAPSDFAMRIEGEIIPAPAAAGLLMLAAVLSPRRRRRT